MLESSGSAAYHLADNEREVIHTSGRRYPLRGRLRDVYRALSYARGHCLTDADLLAIVWRGYAVRENVKQTIANLRQSIALDVVDTVKGFGYILK